VVADGFYLSSGLLNVLLYTYTRPFLLPHSSDSPDDQSIRSESAHSRSNLPAPFILGNIVDRDPSPIEPKSAGPVYDGPEMEQQSVTTQGGRNIGHNGDSWGRIPSVDILHEV